MRQIVLDTETTGLEVSQGHRIIEIGCVEILHRRTTDQTFHQFLNPRPNSSSNRRYECRAPPNARAPVRPMGQNAKPSRTT